MRSVFALALGLGLGCFPAPLDEVGARCSIERPCSAPLFCVSGLCATTLPVDAGHDAGLVGDDAGTTDAGADGGADAGFPVGVNLLRNPSFESALADGGTPFWAPAGGTLISVRQGALHGVYAARLIKSGSTNPSLQSNSVPGQTAFGMLFCAQASVRHEEETFPITIAVRERFSDGGVNASNGGGGRIDGGLWATISESLVTFGNGNAIDVRVSTNAMPADASVLIDDVRLVLASGTACP